MSEWIEEGKPAPDFELQTDRGEPLRLSAQRGKPVVLYFYPADDTPGCTKEACGFRDNLGVLTKAGVVVLGVSRDDERSHQKFKAKYGLNFPLLVDDGKLSDAYGTWVEKNMYGRKYMGMQRATFLIGPDGRIVKVWPKVKPDVHASEVLEALKAVRAA